MNSRRRKADEGGLSCGAAQQHRTSGIERDSEGGPLRAGQGLADRLLYQEARAVAERAYAPYSGFRVGAVVIGPSGRSHHGVNVENAASPAGLCAERAALAAMVAFGEREARRVAVAAADGSDCLPCGLCLQALAEFGDPLIVAVSGGELVAQPLSALLTAPFRLAPQGDREREADAEADR